MNKNNPQLQQSRNENNALAAKLAESIAEAQQIKKFNELIKIEQEILRAKQRSTTNRVEEVETVANNTTNTRQEPSQAGGGASSDCDKPNSKPMDQANTRTENEITITSVD